MKINSKIGRLVGAILPKADASACAPSQQWNECDVVQTSGGPVSEWFICNTNCVGHVTCTLEGYC